MEIFTVEHLNFTYPTEKTPALQDISFSVKEGDFIILSGTTGCGKSTLMRMLKKELTPMGEKSGRICYLGKSFEEVDPKLSASEIGYVMQRPEQQIVTDKVWHELAFGLENMGVPLNLMQRRIAEMAQYFGIETWFEKNTDALSGGQKQLLNLAAIMVMQPRVILLDEPTSRLDPVAAADFLNNVGRLNREMGVTVVLIEHRLEEAIPHANRMLIMEKGRLILDDTPGNTAGKLKEQSDLLEAMPAAVRLYHRMPCGKTVPLTVNDGRSWIRENFRLPENGAEDICLSDVREDAHASGEGEALSFKDVWFRYGKKDEDILRGTDLTIRQGEIFCILGGNGSGKTTALCSAAGLRTPYSGEIRVFGKRIKDYKGRSLYDHTLAMLPQDVQTLFLKNTVREELKDAGTDGKDLPYDLSGLLDRHPYDLSGGEQQLLALAKVLASAPRLLLLDEPTNGLDAATQKGIRRILKTLKEQGMTIVMVTHDARFAAETADRCAMFFRGEVVAVDTPRGFFSGNSFYTTAENRITRGFFNGLVTADDCEAALRAERKG